MLLVLDDVREVAVSRAVCPISLVDLRLKPDQIGALVYRGTRVEPALYHRDSVVRNDGSLRFSNGVSPVSHQPVTDFKPMPSMPGKGASVKEWKEFVEFFHWNKRHEWMLVAEVATAFAAVLPVSEDGVERFIRNSFDVDADGHIHRDELENFVLPFLSQNIDDLQAAAPVIEVPEVWRRSSREEMLQWFAFWDKDESGEIDFAEFRFAVACSIYQALGYAVDIAAKETVAVVFLSEISSDVHPNGVVTRAKFIDNIAPALQANLPEIARIATNGTSPPLLLVVEDSNDGSHVHVEVPGDSTVKTLQRAAQDKKDRKSVV